MKKTIIIGLHIFAALKLNAQSSSYDQNPNNISGFDNTGLGGQAMQSMYSAGTGIGNTAVGNSAMFLNLGGNYNTSHGAYSLFSNSSGNENTGVGYYCLSPRFFGHV